MFAWFNRRQSLKRKFKDVLSYLFVFFFSPKFYLLSDSRATSIVYTRWGKKTCPFGAELILSGGYKLENVVFKKIQIF